MRLVLLVLISFSFIVAGCAKREQPPASAYGEDLLQSAQKIKQEQKEEDAREKALQAEEANRAEEEYESECSRKTGGCKKGYICWDSYFCKQGFGDQCTASGDRMCHKKCVDHGDCPSKMRACAEKPLFHGTERGVLEKFCVKPADR